MTKSLWSKANWIRFLAALNAFLWPIVAVVYFNIWATGKLVEYPPSVNVVETTELPSAPAVIPGTATWIEPIEEYTPQQVAPTIEYTTPEVPEPIETSDPDPEPPTVPPEEPGPDPDPNPPTDPPTTDSPTIDPTTDPIDPDNLN